VKSPSRLLVEIDFEDLQDRSPVYVDHDDDAECICTSYWKGLVSGRTYVAMHESIWPTAAFFRAAEQREMLELEQTTIGGMQ
jgi:hypothetical protein